MMKKIKTTIASSLLFFIVFFIFHSVVENKILLDIYGGNSIFEFLLQIGIILVFILLEKWFKVINLFQYIFLITLGMFAGIYTLHILVPSYMPQSFGGIGYIFHYFSFHYIVNLMIYYIFISIKRRLCTH